jgi:hypothetical protein
MAIEGAKIDSAARPTTGAEHIEPWRAGEQRSQDRGRPQHVTAILGNMRANGVRSLDVQCNQCRHRVIINVDHLPGDLIVPSFGPRTIGADVRPNWRERGQ